MILELITATNLVSFYESDYLLVESCIGEKFRIIEYVNPRYPIHGKHSGYVELRAYIDAAGKYKEVKIVNSEPKRIFDKEARRAVKKWKFNMSKYDERCFNITIKFDIEKAEVMQ